MFAAGGTEQRGEPFPVRFGVGCFLLLYFFTSAVALLGLERHEGKFTGLCGKCRYDLSGLPPNTPCPECGSKEHEFASEWRELVFRPHALPVWSVTFVVLLLCTMQPEWVQAAVDLPWRVVRQNWHGRVMDTRIELIAIAAAMAPPFGRLRSRKAGIALTLAVMLVGYLLSVWVTFM
jgi:hypothetical protein